VSARRVRHNQGRLCDFTTLLTAVSRNCIVYWLFHRQETEKYHRGPFTWDECHRIKIAIERVSQQKRGDEFCRLIPDFQSWFEKKEKGQARPTALELSNVGKLAPSNQPKDYELWSLLFSQSAGVCSGAIKASAATGRDGRLTLGFSYQEGVVEDRMVVGVIQGFESSLQELLYNQQASA
jgi:hypothetical protein